MEVLQGIEDKNLSLLMPQQIQISFSPQLLCPSLPVMETYCYTKQAGIKTSGPAWAADSFSLFRKLRGVWFQELFHLRLQSGLRVPWERQANAYALHL